MKKAKLIAHIILIILAIGTVDVLANFSGLDLMNRLDSWVGRRPDHISAPNESSRESSKDSSSSDNSKESS